MWCVPPILGTASSSHHQARFFGKSTCPSANGTATAPPSSTSTPVWTLATLTTTTSNRGLVRKRSTPQSGPPPTTIGWRPEIQTPPRATELTLEAPSPATVMHPEDDVLAWPRADNSLPSEQVMAPRFSPVFKALSGPMHIPFPARTLTTSVLFPTHGAATVITTRKAPSPN